MTTSPPPFPGAEVVTSAELDTPFQKQTAVVFLIRGRRPCLAPLLLHHLTQDGPQGKGGDAQVTFSWGL